MAAELVSKHADGSIREDLRAFHQMLLVSFSSDQKRMDELKEQYKSIGQYEEENVFSVWENRLGMLVAEFEEFQRVCFDLDELARNQERLVQKAKGLKADIESTQKALQASPNDPKKAKKEEQIKAYQAEMKKTEDLAEMYDRLKKFLAQKMVDFDIGYMKETKKARMASIVKVYSEKAIKYHEEYVDFWKKAEEFFNRPDADEKKEDEKKEDTKKDVEKKENEISEQKAST